MMNTYKYEKLNTKGTMRGEKSIIGACVVAVGETERRSTYRPVRKTRGGRRGRGVC
jgi:hypothetical protein